MSRFSTRFTDPPSTPAELAASPPDRDATGSADLAVELALDLPTNEAQVAQSAIAALSVAADGSTAESPATELRISYRPSRLGERTIPASVPVEVVEAPDAAIAAEVESRLLDSLGGVLSKATPEHFDEADALFGKRVAALPKVSTDAGVPEHLAVRSTPEAAPAALPAAYYPQVSPAEAGARPQPTTVFLPENRQVLWDTAYPWGCHGRVTTARGGGSGCMVGPRHVLTCSHVVDWHADGSAGWMDFVPGFFDRLPGPFGTARAIKYYSFRKVSPPLDTDELRHDYIVAVLDWRIGDRSGWLGSRSYTDSWDGNAWWTHVGYPADFGGLRPTWQGGISFDGDNAQPDSNESIYHWGDVAVGQSGGSFFAWWDGVPHTVAVQSAHDSGRNYASGGSFIPNLINQARTDFP
jgi:V8-like Glu-specific endopeptidase